MKIKKKKKTGKTGKKLTKLKITDNIYYQRLKGGKMKNLLLCGLVLFFISCDLNDQKLIETKETIIRETYSIPSTAKIVQVWPEVSKVTFDFKQLLEKLLTGTQLYAAEDPSKTKDEYFDDGIMYLDNSSVDGLEHELDLSSLIQNKASNVVFIAEWDSGCQDETFEVKFKPHGYNVQYESATCHYGQPSKLAYVITSADCIVDWHHTYSWQFNHSGVNKQIGVIIYLVYYSNGVIVN